MGKTFKMLLATLAVGGSVLAPVAVGAADDKTVLLIYAEARLIPAIITADQTIRSTIQSRSPSPVRFYTEYLDLSWFPSERQERQLTRLMKHKYAGLKVDLIMACGDAALRFALRERAVLFPNVPIVFCGAEHGSIREVRLPPDVTGGKENVVIQCKGRVVRADATGASEEGRGVACVIDSYEFVRNS